MNFEHLDSYESAIKQIATWMSPHNEVDALAFDRDDYESQLRLASWNAQLKFRDRHGFCSPAEHRYVHSALWNTARTWRRRRMTKQSMLWKSEAEAADDAYEVESHIEARLILRGLEFQFGPTFTVLRRLGSAGGKIREAYEPDKDGSYNGFRKRVARLRTTAKRWALTAARSS